MEAESVERDVFHEIVELAKQNFEGTVTPSSVSHGLKMTVANAEIYLELMRGIGLLDQIPGTTGYSLRVEEEEGYLHKYPTTPAESSAA